MTQAPHCVHLRAGVKMGAAEMADTMLRDGLMDAFHGYHMGVTAENVAAKFGITREMQDALAVESQARAAAAWADVLNGVVPLAPRGGRHTALNALLGVLFNVVPDLDAEHAFRLVIRAVRACGLPEDEFFADSFTTEADLARAG